MTRTESRRQYRVDFTIVRPNPKQNRKAFTFTMADSQAEAVWNVVAGHPSETLDELKAEVVR